MVGWRVKIDRKRQTREYFGPSSVITDKDMLDKYSGI
jgi:hypothetical protein